MNSMLWEFSLSKVSYGAKDIEISVAYVTFDTGSSIVYMPMKDFKALLN